MFLESLGAVTEVRPLYNAAPAQTIQQVRDFLHAHEPT